MARNIRADELTEDWKKVLFNQFHDLAAGSGIAVIYKDAQKDYDWVRMSTDEISAGALETVAERIGTLPDPKNWHGIPIVVFNSLGWERSGDATVKIQWPDSGPGSFDVMERTQFSDCPDSYTGDQAGAVSPGSWNSRFCPAGSGARIRSSVKLWEDPLASVRRCDPLPVSMRLSIPSRSQTLR